MRKRLLPIAVVVVVLSRLQIEAATADDVPPNMSTSSLNAEKRISRQLNYCYCTYNPVNLYLEAFGNGNKTRLQRGGRIRKEETVNLLCSGRNMHLLWPNGMRMYQSASLTCDVCQTWGSRELPSCKRTQPGDAFIEMNSTVKILPGGAVEYQLKKRLNIACVNFDNNYPYWYADSQVRPGASYGWKKHGDGYEYKVILNIPEFSRKYTGIYECSTRNLSLHFRPTNLELRIQGDEAPPNMSTTSLNTEKRISEQPENCSCTYNPVNVCLDALVNEKRLKNGGLIRKGETVSLFCNETNSHLLWPNGMRMYQSAPLTCDVCQTWGSSELPSCVWTQAGDTFTEMDKTMKILPGGALEYRLKKLLNIECVTFNNTYPYVFSYSGARPSVSYGSKKLGNQYQYSAFLNIPEFSEKYTGFHECSTRNLSVQNRATKVELRIQEITCRYIKWTDLMTVSYSDNQKIGSYVNFRCIAPGILVGVSRTLCMENGEWKDPEPTCQQPCKIPRVPNGRIGQYDSKVYGFPKYKEISVGEKVEDDEKLFLRCDEGYTPRNWQGTVTCKAGKWSDDPFCEISILCPPIDEKDVFNVLYNNGRKVNSTAHFSCKDVNQKIIGASDTKTCLPTGKWSDGSPECKRTCSAPLVPNGNIQKQLQFGWTTRSWINRNVSVGSLLNDNTTYLLLCHEDYSVQGTGVSSIEITCSDGQWSPDLVCLKNMLCPPIEEKDVFTVVYNNGRKINSTARFYCKDVNQEIVGGNDIWTCQPTGNWSSVGIPECKVSQCAIKDLLESDPEILVPNLGNVDGGLVLAGVEVPLLCRGNQILVGSSKAKCERKGKWMYGNHHCIDSCHLDPESISHQLIIDPPKTNFIFGESVDLSCPIGMKLTSSVEMLMCMGSRWSDEIPGCQ